MLRLPPRLLRLVSAAGLVLGMIATQAAANERIRFTFRSEAEVRGNWVEVAGTWAVKNERYVGRPGKDPTATAIYLDNSRRDLSDFRGFVVMTVPKDGTSYILVRAQGQRGYLLGFLNRLGNTHLRVVKRDVDGETTVLCDKVVRPPPTGFQQVRIFVSGSQLRVSNSDVECRGFDRSFGDGRFGVETRGGSARRPFRVESIDVFAK